MAPLDYFSSRPRRVAGTIVVALALAALAAWLPAVAGGGAESPALDELAPQPESFVVERVGVFDPMRVTRATAETVVGMQGVSIPLRVPDLAEYLLMKSTPSRGAQIPETSSVLATPLLTTPTIGTAFNGLNAAESCSGCEPPDTQVAAGPNHVVEADNVQIRIFDKSGSTIRTVSLNSLFAVGNVFVSDPRIRYDTLSSRWFISMLSFDNANLSAAHNGRFDLAVSTTSDPTQPFNIYSLTTANSFPDQPALGFNDDKVITSANSFSCTPNCNSGGFQGNEFVVWNKSDLLAGNAASVDFFAPPQDTSTPNIIQPVKSRSSTSTLFMVSASGSTLKAWSVTGIPGVGGGSSAGKTTRTISALVTPPNAVQQGSAVLIDTGDTRMQDAVFRDGQIWVAGDDRCTPSGDISARACLRYIQILTAGLTVNQDFDFGVNATYHYYPSVDLDSSGSLVTAFSRSSSTEFPSVYINSRLPGDPANTLGTSVLAKAGVASYAGSFMRWGDYSGAGVDPSDESMVWVAGEYSTNATGTNWGTWIAQARANSTSPTPTATATPTPTPTPTATATSTPTPTATATATPTPTPTPTSSPTPGPQPGSKLKWRPKAVKFGKVGVGAGAKSHTLSIKNAGTATLSVSLRSSSAPFAISSGGEGFTVNPKNSHAVTIEFQPVSPTAASGSLQILSSDPAHPSVEVPLSGTGVPGKIKARPKSVKLKANASSHASKTLNVLNKGKGALHGSIGDISGGGPFTISGGGAFSLGPKGSKSATIDFAPPGAGTFSGSVAITSDDPTAPSISVPIIGKAK
jgi:cell division septation protein DedD